MKIKIRYNNEFQTLEVDRNEMWVSLALGNSDELSTKEMEKHIQDKFNEMFNRPEYNNWHRHNRLMLEMLYQNVRTVRKGALRKLTHLQSILLIYSRTTLITSVEKCNMIMRLYAVYFVSP